MSIYRCNNSTITENIEKDHYKFKKKRERISLLLTQTTYFHDFITINNNCEWNDTIGFQILKNDVLIFLYMKRKQGGYLAQSFYTNPYTNRIHKTAKTPKLQKDCHKTVRKQNDCGTTQDGHMGQLKWEQSNNWCGKLVYGSNIPSPPQHSSYQSKMTHLKRENENSCWRPQANSRKGHKNNTQTLTVLNIIYKKITNDIRLSGLHSIHREGAQVQGLKEPRRWIRRNKISGFCRLFLRRLWQCQSCSSLASPY